jgi:peptidyl-prolyl cis-trans isomerase B (cyclophilin B)
MKLLAGLVMAITVAVAPATGLTQDNSTSKQGADMVTVTMETNKGVITLELDREKAPDSVENFVTYAKSGHYDGTIFHRVIPGFMIQGGGFDTSMQQKDTNPPIKNEAANGLKNDKGTVAMARTNVPDSATSQFFINVKDNDFLNHTSPTPQGWGYAVFGKVTDGMDVVESIENVSTANKGGQQDVPVSEVIIEKVTVQE